MCINNISNDDCPLIVLRELILVIQANAVFCAWRTLSDVLIKSYLTYACFPVNVNFMADLSACVLFVFPHASANFMLIVSDVKLNAYAQ